MAGYIVANYKVTNPEGYENYVPSIMGTFEPHNCEILVADYESETLEGDPPHVTIVLKFPSKEAARGWYESDEYQAAMHHRTDNTEGQMVIVDEFSMPE